MQLEVIYPANLKAGDILAGEVVPGSPTRPVHPMARALTVGRVERWTDDDGQKWMRPWFDYSPDAAGSPLLEFGSGLQFLIIRP